MLEPIKLMDDRLMQQAMLEKEMSETGASRFLSRVQSAKAAGAEDTTSYGNWMSDSLIGAVAGKLGELLAARASGKAGPKGVAVKRLSEFCDDLAAPTFIALRMVISTFSKNQTLPRRR